MPDKNLRQHNYITLIICIRICVLVLYLCIISHLSWYENYYVIQIRRMIWYGHSCLV